MKHVTLLLSICLLSSCYPKVRTSITANLPPLSYDQQVVVVAITEKEPANAILLGTVKIGDTGFSTNCGWDEAIEEAKAAARKAGGNIIKITEHKPPAVFGSSCHRITCKIMKLENRRQLMSLYASEVVDSTWTYAKLYVYRGGGQGFAVGYDLYLGDSLIWRAKHNSCAEIIITREGREKLWAKTESKTEIPIEFEHGREYYLRCGLKTGAFIGRPSLQITDPYNGRAEYWSVKRRPKNR